MPATPKRLPPLAPDPRWELDLGLAQQPKAASGKSTDELLSHALLVTHPDAFDDFDNAGDRATAPPPEGHFERMMAEAAQMEDLDPTPAPRVPRPGPAAGPALAPRTGLGPAVPIVPSEMPAVLWFDEDLTPVEPLLRSAREERAARPIPKQTATVEKTPRATSSVTTPRVRDARREISEPADVPAPSPREPIPASLAAPAFGDLDIPDILRPVEIDEPGLPSPRKVPPAEARSESRESEARPQAAATRSNAPSGPATSSAPRDKLQTIEARFQAGDFGGALRIAEAAAAERPDDPAIETAIEKCREALYRTYLDRLGSAEKVPRVALRGDAIKDLALDHRAGFLLACVDGVSTIDEIIDVSAMPGLEAVRILYELLQEGVIEMRAGR